jgi:hypothetical protein
MQLSYLLQVAADVTIADDHAQTPARCDWHVLHTTTSWHALLL